jgi:putative oxidoreductase
MITTQTLPAASGKGRLITLWTLSGLVALTFIAAAGGKLAGAANMVEMFDKVGLGQWFRYFTGILEIVGAIGLLVSRYAFYAAVLLAVVMVGAIFAHVAVLGGSPAPAAVLLVLSAVIAYLRKPQQ